MIIRNLLNNYWNSLETYHRVLFTSAALLGSVKLIIEFYSKLGM